MNNTLARRESAPVWSVVVLLAVGMCLTACAGPVESMVRGESKVDANPDKVAVAPTQFYYDHFDVSKDEMFETNLGVGYLKHVGGYVEREREGGAGTYRRSRQVKVNLHEEYQDEIGQRVAQSISGTLRDNGLSVADVASDQFPASEFEPRKKERYAEPSETGDDNVNNPYFDTFPAQSGKSLDVNAGVVVVPYVVYYYMHNRGWFIGQKWGCPAGGRFRLMWAAYDTSNGELLGWSDIDLKVLEEGKFMPNQSEIETYRKQLHEAMFDKWLEKSLPF